VSLRILFADDSMTAQNMGKKILSEAGYEVVAVSNGAAAVKKIAEQKPDIIILDVYMPGYTGLEVCEKVRGSLETLKTPVLLTVGKLEPYKPEDANRVKADGVIIKPFEASDLLAIIKKFEERLGSAPPPAQQPVLAERQYEEELAAEAPAETQTASNRASMQPMVEVPDHMASAAAFGDMLGSEPTNSTSHFAVNTPSAAFETSVIVPAPPIVADYGAAAAQKEEEKTESPVVAEPAQPSPEAVMPELDAAPEITVAPVEIAPEPAPAPEAEAVVEAHHPQFIPVYKEPEPPTAHYDFVPTAAPAVEDVEIPREPALQETAEETTRSTVADQVEPGLMPTFVQPPDDSPVQHAAEPEVQASVAETGSLPVTANETSSAVSDADFEARVAAAMAAYSQADSAQAHSSTEPANAMETSTLEAPIAEARSVAAEIPSFEYRPPVRDEEPVSVVEMAHEGAEAPGSSVEHAAVQASVEAAIPEAAAAIAGADSDADHHHTIAQAVHRVMERLKPELVEEIMKELKSKK
jgi:CheY-like chemotaxis protein